MAGVRYFRILPVPGKMKIYAGMPVFFIFLSVALIVVQTKIGP